MYKDTIEKLTAAGLNPGKTIAETKKKPGRTLSAYSRSERRRKSYMQQAACRSACGAVIQKLHWLINIYRAFAAQL